MNKEILNAVYSDDIPIFLEKLGLREKFENSEIKCKFSGEIITYQNLYSIFPESGDIKFVCDKPEVIKEFNKYINQCHK